MKLASEKVFTATSFEEATQLLHEQFSLQRNLMNYRDLEITENFNIILHGIQEYRLTPFSLGTLCKVLKIPDPFAKKIPEDLLLYNIRRLLNERPFDYLDVIIDTKGEHRVLGVTSYEPHRLIDPLLLLDYGTPSSKEAYLILLSDSLFQFEWIEKEWPVIDTPNVGDIVNMGVSVVSGFLRPFADARVFLHQLVCSNGMSLPRNFGTARVRGGDRERPYEIFSRKIEALGQRAENVRNAWQWMKRTYLNSDQFARYWRAINRILQDDEETDHLFNSDVEQREIYLRLAVEERRTARELFSDPSFSITHVLFGDVQYNITREAQRKKPLKRVQLVDMASKLLNEYHIN